MSTLPDPEIPAPHTEQESPAIDLSRRKLGMGLGVSAIFTLASRPVLAGACTTPSAAASGNLSQHGPVISCSGRSPAQWVATTPSNNQNNGFPGGNVNFHLQTTPPALNGVFKKGSRADWDNKTLRQVMAAGDNGNASPSANPISKEFAATLLNIRDGSIPASILTETGLIGMWNEWMDTGAFTPKANATWGTDLIVKYLRTLQVV